MRAVDEHTQQYAIDTEMMDRCIRLSAAAVKLGEFPFAAVIAEGRTIIVETSNFVARNADITRHAELIAVSEAQQKLGRKDLSACTLYSNVEPCPMCSFAIRETRIGRVVFAISSPLMGGSSKWQILRDSELHRVMPEAFGPAPELIAGLMRKDAESVWRRWNPLIWAVIKHRGVFGAESPPYRAQHLPAAPEHGGLIYRLFRWRHNQRSRS